MKLFEVTCVCTDFTVVWILINFSFIFFFCTVEIFIPRSYIMFSLIDTSMK